MDIYGSAWIAAFVMALVAALFLRASVKTMQSARRVSFYLAQRQRNMAALRLFIVALAMFGIAIAFFVYGRPVLYAYYPPTPTTTPTPTITLIPTVTQTPTIMGVPTETSVPSVTGTPTITVTPFIPLAVEALFKGIVTPNPDALFTEIQFSTAFVDGEALNPSKYFQPPIQTMYGGFDYNFTNPGTQWTALWFRNGELVYYETKPWDGGTGGIGGYTECSNPVGGWIPGNYEVQIFMGYEWKKIGRFTIFGLGTPLPKP